MKIKTRLILLIPAIFLALALLTVISYLNSQRQAADLVEAQAQNIALEQSALIFNNLRQAEEAVVFLTSTLLEMRAAGLTDRESLNHLVKSYAASSKNFFGVWAIFEPNAYDGKDAEFVDNEALGNSEGRANAYWLQKDGGLGYDLSDDYDQEPYYVLPQQKGGLIIIPPYRDMDTENKTLMSSIVMPIIESGRFLGAVGIDIEMDFIQNLIESIKPYETGYAMLVSDAGSIIAQPDSAEISENLPQVSAEILQQIRQGEPFSIRDESIQDKNLMECFYIPVKLGSFESPWYFMVALPHDKVMAEANRSLYLQLAIGIIVLIALLVLVFYTANGVSSPLRRIVGYAQAVAAGNFNSSIDVKSKDEVGSMVNALRSMVTQLKERLGFTQGIMHGIVTPFAVVDIQGRMTYLNPQLIAYWGLKGEPEKYFGKTSGEFFYGNADDKTPLDKVLMDKSLIQNMPISSINAEGHKKYMSMTAAPLWDLDGNLLGACMLITDETEVREQQARILSLNERITMSVKEAHSISGQQAEAFKRLDSQLDKTSAAALNQNAASEQTMESVAAMSRTLEMLAQKALKTTEDTKDTRREAEDGKRIVNETVDCIHKVAEYARRAAQGMEALGKQADGITHIVELIRDIADQTNLLALNAAIEAARAGDAGRGFAVVADEVRKLAEKTTQATNDVQTSVSALQGGVRQNMGLIDETVQLAGTSTQLAQQSGESLHRIVNIADNAVEEVSAIAQATGEESRTSTKMVGSMTEISAMARQSAENMKDSMDAVSRLAMFSEQLKNLIESMGSDRRKADRCQLDSPYFVTIEGTGIRSVSCRVLDISVTGVRLEVQKGIRTEGWQKVIIRLHADRPPLNTLLNSASGEVVWQDGILCGVEFDKPLNTTFEQLTLLIAKGQKGLF